MAEQETSTVREMSAEERNSYQGITIDEHTESSYSRARTQGGRYGYAGGTRGLHLSVGSLLSGRYNFLMKIGLVLGAAALAAFLFFVVLPSAIVLLGVGVAVWFVLKLIE